MTSQYEKYRTRGDELNDEYFNKRWKDIDTRLNALESVLSELQDAADTLVRIGVERLNTAVNTALADFQEKADSIQQMADALQAQTADLQTLVDNLLETLGEEFHLDGGTF